ncbi:hypothetical protein ACFGVR_11865 [Mucilaginibacter sp. AW1-3]
MKDEKENMEWINEYQALKLVNPANPFAVPVNYFDEMEGQVMGQIRLDELDTKQGFTVPENYFNELEQHIQSRIAIDEVLNNEKGFTVPEGYFSELEQNIQSRIAIDEVLSNEKGFTVPTDYFNELEQNIQNRIAIDEFINSEQSFTVPEGYFNELEQNIQSRIAIAQNAEEGFAVPAGYFEALESKILAQTTLAQPEKAAVKKQPATIVSMWSKHAIKYASAACFAMIAGAALFLSEFNTTNANASHQHTYLHKAVAKMSSDEIEAYLELNTDVTTIVTGSDTDNDDLQAVINAEQAIN